MTINHLNVTAAIAKAAHAAELAESELNAADSKLGDGDTGLMLRRWLARIAQSVSDDQDDLGELFRVLAAESGKATGSSLGSLGTTALLTLARELSGRKEIQVCELGELLSKIRDAMLARGGANLGDKTVVDVVDRIAKGICEADNQRAASAKAVAIARKALEDFRSQPNRIGRARMFADKSRGLNDPGMLAAVRVTEAICGS